MEPSERSMRTFMESSGKILCYGGGCFFIWIFLVYFIFWGFEQFQILKVLNCNKPLNLVKWIKGFVSMYYNISAVLIWKSMLDKNLACFYFNDFLFNFQVSYESTSPVEARRSWVKSFWVTATTLST